MSRSHINQMIRPMMISESWPPSPHARFADIPAGLVVLGKIVSWHDPAVEQQQAAKQRRIDTAHPIGITENASNSGDSLAVATDQDISPDPAAVSVSAPSETLGELFAPDQSAAPFPDLQANIHYQPALQRVVQALTKALPYGRSRVTQWHAIDEAQAVATWSQLWALANCWSETRTEPLLMIDATTTGVSLSSWLGWQAPLGWSDLLNNTTTLSTIMQRTPRSTLRIITRGQSNWQVEDESNLRLASALKALQRDYRAIWVITSGAWTEESLSHATQAHARQLLVPLGTAVADWQGFAESLVQRNLFIHGWLGLATAQDSTLNQRSA